MTERSFIQSTLDSCLLPLALARDFVRRYNPFGHKERQNFAKRKWLRGVRKFATVNNGVYIGSTPTIFGLKNLRKQGIKTIVNLRASLDYHDKASELGFNYFMVPLNGKRPPEESQVIKFLKVFQDSDNLPLFFHCNRARNRTYMLLGIYRIAIEGWNSNKAIAEMNHFGYKNIPDNVLSFLEHFSNGGLKKIRAKIQAD